MKIIVSLLFVLALVGVAFAQTYAMNEMTPAEAVKVTSRLSVGTREEEAERFMQTNGLKAAYTLVTPNDHDALHYYHLSPDNYHVTLQFSVSGEKTHTNRLLTTAWLSHGTNFGPEVRINLKKTPGANASTNALGRAESIDRKEIQEFRELLQNDERPKKQ